MSDLAQGYSASLILNPGDSYRVSTPGTATVQVAYGGPSGTTTLTAQSRDFGPYDANAKLEVVAVSGTCSYSLLAAIPVTKIDGQYSDPELQSIVAGVWTSAKPRILFIGDSITDYGSAYQTMAMTTGLFPFGGAAFSIISLSWANGSGTSGTLNFNKAAQTLRWTAPGDTAGAPVDVSRAGVYTIPSGTVAKTITVVCRPRAYSSATEGDYTVSTTATTEYSRRSGKTYAYWAHAKSGAAFEVSTLGNGGSQIRDVTESSAWQIQAGTYDAIVCLVGANDIPSDRTLPQVIEDYSALLPVLKSKAPRVFMLTLLPRSSGMTTARRQIMAAANKWLLSLRMPGVTVVNAFSRLVDPASATADQFSGALEDGLHPAVPGGEAIGEAVYLALADAFAFDSVTVMSSQADTYDATNNPQGNRLPAGGTFTGTGGTAGTGVSTVGTWASTTAYALGQCVITSGRLYAAIAAGTSGSTAPAHTAGQVMDGTVLWQYVGSGAVAAIAANWSVTRDSGSNITAACVQFSRTDGLPGTVQRIVLANPGGAAETILIAPLNATRPTVAAGQVWKARGAIVASSLSGVQSITLGIEPAAMSGAFISSWGANNVAGSVMSGTKRKMVMEPFPLEIPSGASIINIAIRVTLAAGGAATLDLLPGEWTLWRES